MKLQISTIVPPAKRPGRISGSVILRKTVQRDAPRFAAACSIAGSRFASAAETFKKRIGYRLSDSSRMMPPMRALPIQSIGEPWEMMSRCCAIAVSTPNRPRICRMPIAPTNGGRISGTSSKPLTTDLPQNSSRTLISASGTAMIVTSSVTQTAMVALLIRPLRRPASWKIDST